MRYIFTQGQAQIHVRLLFLSVYRVQHGHRQSFFCQRKQMLDDEMIVLAGRRVSWSLC